MVFPVILSQYFLSHWKSTFYLSFYLSDNRVKFVSVSCFPTENLGIWGNNWKMKCCQWYIKALPWPIGGVLTIEYEVHHFGRLKPESDHHKIRQSRENSRALSTAKILDLIGQTSSGSKLSANRPFPPRPYIVKTKLQSAALQCVGTWGNFCRTGYSLSGQELRFSPYQLRTISHHPCKQSVNLFCCYLICTP